MFTSSREKTDHEQLMKAIDEMDIAETPCMSYPEAFFSDDDLPPGASNGEFNIAKRLCRDCPIINECLAYAVKWPQFGVWGGTSALERRNMRERRAYSPRQPKVVD